MKYLISIFLLIVTLSCEKDNNLQHSGNKGGYYWRVDTTDMSGTTIRETFPVITQVNYITPSASELPDASPVMVTKKGGQVFVYPFAYMTIEVINEAHNSRYFVANYCPITRTSMVWDPVINDTVLTFAASGVLYKENLVLYDTESRRLWSQMLIKKIYGDRNQTQPRVLQSFETKMSVIRSYFPNARVYNGEFNSLQNEGLGKNLKDNDPDDGSNNPSELYTPGEKVYGIILSGKILTKSYNDMSSGLSVEKQDGIVLVSDKSRSFATSFYDDQLNLQIVEKQFPTILIDKNGRKYNVFGEPVNLSGVSLEAPHAYWALWWVWEEFYDKFNKIDE